MPDRAALYQRVLTELGTAELERVKLLIGSRTLREAIRLIVDVNEGRAELYIPHYWALYYHDGRKGFGPILASKLVFFDDPRDDPRLAGGYPERDFDIRTLTRDEYEAGLEENRRRRESGLGPFMFVVDSVGPAAAHPFFDQLSNNAASRADFPVGRAVDDWVQQMVDEDPAVRPERGTAEFFL
jgi:hypothetical protein